MVVLCITVQKYGDIESGFGLQRVEFVEGKFFAKKA
jgi:hypothetical protein